MKRKITLITVSVVFLAGLLFVFKTFRGPPTVKVAAPTSAAAESPATAPPTDIQIQTLKGPKDGIQDIVLKPTSDLARQSFLQSTLSYIQTTSAITIDADTKSYAEVPLVNWNILIDSLIKFYSVNVHTFIGQTKATQLAVSILSALPDDVFPKRKHFLYEIFNSHNADIQIFRIATQALACENPADKKILDLMRISLNSKDAETVNSVIETVEKMADLRERRRLTENIISQFADMPDNSKLKAITYLLKVEMKEDEALGLMRSLATAQNENLFEPTLLFIQKKQFVSTTAKDVVNHILLSAVSPTVRSNAGHILGGIDGARK